MPAPPNPFSHKHSSQVQHREPGGRMSPRKFSGRDEVYTYRQSFAAIWQSFLHNNFESHVEAAFYFRVDPTTAEKWWAGGHAPQGWVIGKAIQDENLRDAAIQWLAGI